jgi:hypothetical protein
MEDPLDEAIAILKEFEVALEQGRQLWVPKDNVQPWEQEWEKKHAQCWIYGTTHMLEFNALERYKIDKSLSPMAADDARKYIRKWKKSLKDNDTYYDPAGEDFRFKMPKKDEKLAAFIYNTSLRIEKMGFGARLERRAFKSFLAYLRRFGPDAAFLELIFPKKMHLHHGRIARKISNEAYAIPKETAAAILVALAKNCYSGRKDTRATAAECLGLCWLCLTASRLHLPVYFENILSLNMDALILSESLPTLNILTLFGDVNIKISQRMGRFLHALSRVPSPQPRTTILQRSKRSLTRIFDEVLKTVTPTFECGNITFVSLLSLPHHFGKHRCQNINI